VSTVVEQALAYWATSNAQPAPGASDAELAAFEAAHGVRLPPAFAALYRRADGNGGGDGNLTRFWPLAEVRPLPEEEPEAGWEAVLPDAREYFVFADYMIWSHAYAVRLTAGGSGDRVLWVFHPGGGRGPECAEVAASFEEFLADYTRDPDAICRHPDRA
jgi:hypothetical protein